MNQTTMSNGGGWAVFVAPEGPYPQESVAAWLTTGQLSHEIPLCPEGGEEWRPATAWLEFVGAWMLAGIWLGAAVVVRYNFGLLALAAVIQELLRRRWKPALGAVAGGLIVAAALGALDWATWGHPFESMLKYPSPSTWAPAWPTSLAASRGPGCPRGHPLPRRGPGPPAAAGGASPGLLSEAGMALEQGAEQTRDPEVRRICRDAIAER